jgi:hypothetical protein
MIKVQDEKIHSLIHLEQFKAVLGIDDRDDKLAGTALLPPPTQLNTTV